MKKTIGLVFAAAFAAAIFFGCSNSSSDNSALLLAMGGNGGSSAPDRTGLPDNVGTNELAGKTFSRTDANTTYKNAFGSDTVTYTSIGEIAAVDNVNTAYKMEIVYVYPYSYNATTKQLFNKNPSYDSLTQTFIRNGVRTTIATRTSYSSDADFLAYQKSFIKLQKDLCTDEQIEAAAKQQRYGTFSPYGYTDNTNATPVSAEQIAKYNAVQAEQRTRSAQLVGIQAYQLSGSTLKILASDRRIPAGKGLNEIYGVFNTSLSIVSGYILSYSTSYVTIGPDIKGTTNYKVDSISGNAINTSATATGTYYNWTYTPAARSFSYNTNKTESGATFTIDGLGVITIDYATADNIPADWTSATTYTLE